MSNIGLAGDDSDEYSYDDLEGINLDNIPEMRGSPTGPTHPQQSDANETNHATQHSTQQDSYHLAIPSDHVAEQSAQAIVPTAVSLTPKTRQDSPTPSSDYGDEGIYNEDFLKELASLESQILTGTKDTGGPSSTVTTTVPTNLTATASTSKDFPPSQQTQEEAHKATASNCDDNEGISRSSTAQKRPSNVDEEAHGAPCPCAASSTHDEGRSASKRLKVYTDMFEDEMTCPICCDLFACAYLFNPCGHSYCGECGLTWVKKNKYAPICAVCRMSVEKNAPMIMNITLDSAVRSHIDALKATGDKAWQEGGKKLVEWTQRKEQWKADGVIRMNAFVNNRKSRKR